MLFSYEKAKVILAESGNITFALVIEDGVTEIGSYAFAYNQLTKETIPAKVTGDWGCGVLQKPTDRSYPSRSVVLKTRKCV